MSGRETFVGVGGERDRRFRIFGDLERSFREDLGDRERRFREDFGELRSLRDFGECERLRRSELRDRE